MRDPRRLPVLADQLSRALDVGWHLAHSGLVVLLPPVVGGFKRELLADPSGSKGLIDTLLTICGRDLLCDALKDIRTTTAKGDLLLAQIFGLTELSRIVAESAARSSGLDRRLLRAMLPVIAVLVARHLVDAHRAASAPRQRHSLSDIFLGLLASAGHRPGPDPVLRSMLEIDSPGNPLDDVIRSASDPAREIHEKLQRWPR